MKSGHERDGQQYCVIVSHHVQCFQAVFKAGDGRYALGVVLPLPQLGLPLPSDGMQLRTMQRNSKGGECDL